MQHQKDRHYLHSLRDLCEVAEEGDSALAEEYNQGYVNHVLNTVSFNKSMEASGRSIVPVGRIRAGTMPSLAMKPMPPPVLPSNSLCFLNNRHRSGSLTLPNTYNYWRNIAEPSSELPQGDDIARTLRSLGLDDDKEDSEIHGSPLSSTSASLNTPSSRTTSTPSPNILPQKTSLRSRSYSVNNTSTYQKHSAPFVNGMYTPSTPSTPSTPPPPPPSSTSTESLPTSRPRASSTGKMDYHARMGLSSLWKMQLDTLHDDLADSPSAEPSLSLGDSELLANMLHHNPGYQADIESNQANSFIPIPTRSVSTSTMANSQLNVSRSLWIGNMDGSITMDDLTSLFSFYGPIESIRLLLEKECAFINFFHVEDAVRAKEDVLTNLGGRIGSCIIRIGYGRAENTLTPFSMHSPATTLIEQPVVSQPTRALWLGNLPSGATQSVLQNIFCSFGTIEFIRVLTQKNCAFVNFETVKSASTARDALLQHELSVKELWGIRLGFAKVPLSSSSTKTKPSVSYVDTSLEDENINQEIWIMMKELGANENAKSIVKAFQSFSYHESIPSVPEFGLKRKHDTVKLREIRKKLDTFTTKEDTKYADAIALDCMNEIAEICSDYIGNTVVQRLFEKCSENLKTIMLETIAPHLAALGVHKNGTWAAQKIIDSLTTPKQFQMVFSHIQPYVPPLLLDQFGNYVVQCCLRLEGDTQFIVNAMVEKFFHIAQGRFGARAIRGILEGDLMNPFQKIFVSAALLQNAVLLATHSNGALLISWFMDCRLMENRHKLLASQLSFNLAQVATHKLGSQILLRLVNQNIEIKAKQYILNELHNQETLKEIVSDHTRGLSFVLKVLSSEYTTVEEKADLKAAVCPILKQLQGAEFRKALVEISALKSVKTVQ